METYKIILFSTSLIVFLSYFFTIIFKFGVQKSYSDSYFKLKKENQWIFTVTIWGFAIPLLVIGGQHHFLFFLATLLIMAVGSAPAFKRGGLELKVHMFSAIGGIIAALVAFALTGMLFLACLLTLIVGLIQFSKMDNKVWWIEAVMFLGVWSGLVMKALM